MKQQTTATKILCAADQLFSEQGFTHTTLRQITELADVNLASVNYHFGSKKSLIQAVLQSYLDLIIPVIEQNLDQLAETPTCKQLLEAILKPLIMLNQSRVHNAKNFMVLVGRGYSESQGHLRRYIASEHGQTVQRIWQCFARALPHIGQQALFLRLHFTLGSLVFVLTSNQALEEISVADFNQIDSLETILDKFIQFAAQGLQADSSITPVFAVGDSK